MPAGHTPASVRTVTGPDPRSDAALLAAHIAGDRHAFAVLLARYHPRLYRLACRRSDCAEDAADAVQEALLAAYRSAGGFRHDSAVGSWLHRIVVNACLDRRRQNARGPIILPRIDGPPLPDHGGAVDTVLTVRQALLHLPADQRAAVIAVDMFGYSLAETARMLGVAEGTLKSRRFRARVRLAALLLPEAPPQAA